MHKYLLFTDSPVKKKESVPKIEEAKLETPIPATGAGTFKQHQAGNSDEETESKVYVTLF